MQHWLVKQEPEAYSWSDFLKEGLTAWTGVRNFAARNNLRAMQKDDQVFYYHSGEEKSIVGLAKVGRSSYPDPTAEEGDWVAVDLVPIEALKTRVTLQQIKTDSILKGMKLVKQSRLSVSPVSPEQFRRVMQLSKAGK